MIELELSAAVPNTYTLMYSNEGLAHCAMDDFNAGIGAALQLADTVNNRTLTAIMFALLGAHQSHLPSLLHNYCTGLHLLSQAAEADRSCVDGVLDVRHPHVRLLLEADRRTFVDSHPSFARQFAKAAFLRNADEFLPRPNPERASKPSATAKRKVKRRVK